MIPHPPPDRHPSWEHDPLVCGLDYLTDCASCRDAALARERAWAQRCRRGRLRSERRHSRPEARRLVRLVRLHPRLIGRALVAGIGDELAELVQHHVGRALAQSDGRARP